MKCHSATPMQKEYYHFMITFFSPQIPPTSPHVLSQVNESEKKTPNNHTPSFSGYVVLQWLLCLLLVEVCMMSFLVTHSEVLLNEV